MFNRRVLERHLADRKTPLSLLFAIPDHPWVDAADGAAVRIAMTVAAVGSREGRLLTLVDERSAPNEAEGRLVRFTEQIGRIFSNLRIGADIARIKPLRSNFGLSAMGVKLHGQGFLVSHAKAQSLRLGSVNELEDYIRPYLSGRDLAQRTRGLYVIDLFGLSESEVRDRFPLVYQHLLDTVKPESPSGNFMMDYRAFGS